MGRFKIHGFITEQDVHDTWPFLLPSAIRTARRNGELPYYQFLRGPHFKIADVEAYIERKFRRDATDEKGTEILIVPSPDLRPERPIAPTPRIRETMAEEEERVRREALIQQGQARLAYKKQREAEAVQKKRGAPSPPQADIAGLDDPSTAMGRPERPETREEEIDRIRAEVYAERIKNRPTPSQRRAAEAAAAAKAAKAAKGRGGRRPLRLP